MPEHTRTFKFSQWKKYLQIVGESTESCRDGGESSPGAVGAPIFVAAAGGGTHSRRLPLTGGTRAEEPPQTYPKQPRTHFLRVGSGGTGEEERPSSVLSSTTDAVFSYVVGQLRHKQMNTARRFPPKKRKFGVKASLRRLRGARSFGETFLNGFLSY